MSTELAVSCQNITKTYHTDGADTPALRGVNLSVRKGELLMLVGPSGCGKTTLISVIAGILSQDSGTCTVYGNNFHDLPDNERTRLRGKMLGFVFQSYNLIPTLTVEENICIPLLLQGEKFNEALTHARDVLSLVKLSDKAKQRPYNLSGGQQQRVAIARALVHRPKLIVCDEPTSALDQDTGHAVMELFREVAVSDDRALIIVTHDSRIFSFADRIARMNDGVITDENSTT